MSRPREFKNILIRSVNWIGDAVMTIPAIGVIRKAFRDSKITLLSRSSVMPVFEGNPDIDESIIYSDNHRSLTGRLRLVSSLRKERFSKAFLLQNAFDAALITFLARIPERIGYDRDGRGLLLTKPVPFNNEDRVIHHIDYYLNLVYYVTGRRDISFFSPYVRLSIRERLEMRKRLQNFRRPLLGMNPGATYGSAKRWLPDRFAEVADWFIKDTGGSVLITGSAAESSIADEIIKYLDPEIRASGLVNNLAGDTTLRELISLISECDIFLSNDSGPMHLAYAVGTPLLALFGSTDPSLTGPRDEGSIVLKADVGCSPCFRRECDNDMLCMYGINSEDVYLALKRLLPSKRAVFFDRDGTLCEDVGYLNSWNNFKVFDDIKAINLLKDNNFLLIGISNQSGIGRGIIKESFVKEVNDLFIERYGFNHFLYCPHHPDEHCPCRKPELGMVHKARSLYNIDLRRSYVIGDKDDDMLLAKAIGAKGILVKTGRSLSSPYADSEALNLKDAVRIILNDTTT